MDDPRRNRRREQQRRVHRQRRLTAAVIAVVLVAVVAALALRGGGSSSKATATAAESSNSQAAAVSPPAQPIADAGPVKVAAVGDTNMGSLPYGLPSDGGASLFSQVKPLLTGDIVMGNLEGTLSSGGGSKCGSNSTACYAFHTPPSYARWLKDAGFTVMNLANNHALDYGRVGLADTLAASRRYGLPVIGAGADVAGAYTPYRATVRGVRVAFLAATDVLDTFAIPIWPATAARAGLASVKDPGLLLDAVRRARADSDVVVVDLHWGVELHSCPTPRQQQLARLLTAAGADVVVGSHAHVLGPNVRTGRTAVHYGLGNFVFYADGGAAAESGVYTVTVDSGGVLATGWTPAVIRGGRPQLLTGSAARAAASREAALAGRCGLGPIG